MKENITFKWQYSELELGAVCREFNYTADQIEPRIFCM